MHTRSQPISRPHRHPPGGAGERRFLSLVLDADAPDTGEVSRRWTAQTLEEWCLGLPIGDVTLCVSELIGNVVKHATPDGSVAGTSRQRQLVLTLRSWQPSLYVEVLDEDSSPPTLPVGELLPEDGLVEEFDETGRGLLIVQKLADATWWAPQRNGAGKSVFCRFDYAQNSECPGGQAPDREDGQWYQLPPPAEHS